MTTALDSSSFEFWIRANHNSLLSIATKQFASFCLDIRSRQCYFRVCQSGEIWNKRAFFPCILIFLLYKTNRFHVAVRLFSSYHILTSSVIYYWTDARQHGICLLSWHFFYLSFIPLRLQQPCSWTSLAIIVLSNNAHPGNSIEISITSNRK